MFKFCIRQQSMRFLAQRKWKVAILGAHKPRTIEIVFGGGRKFSKRRRCQTNNRGAHYQIDRKTTACPPKITEPYSRSFKCECECVRAIRCQLNVPWPTNNHHSLCRALGRFPFSWFGGDHSSRCLECSFVFPVVTCGALVLPSYSPFCHINPSFCWYLPAWLGRLM